jgi:hypothetical protein
MIKKTMMILIIIFITSILLVCAETKQIATEAEVIAEIGPGLESDFCSTELSFEYDPLILPGYKFVFNIDDGNEDDLLIEPVEYELDGGDNKYLLAIYNEYFKDNTYGYLSNIVLNPADQLINIMFEYRRNHVCKKNIARASYYYYGAYKGQLEGFIDLEKYSNNLNGEFITLSKVAALHIGVQFKKTDDDKGENMAYDSKCYEDNVYFGTTCNSIYDHCLKNQDCCGINKKGELKYYVSSGMYLADSEKYYSCYCRSEEEWKDEMGNEEFYDVSLSESWPKMGFGNVDDPNYYHHMCIECPPGYSATGGGGVYCLPI